MHLEVEQKYPVSDLEQITATLVALGAELGEEIEQADYYFNHPARDFAETDEALRIRRVGSRNRITFKGPKLDQLTKTRQEIELRLGDGDGQAESWRELLEALGFTPVAIVRKVRRPGKLPWKNSDVTIALDNVRDVGQFIELELTADTAGLDSARECILDLAGALQLADQERRSYLELLLGRTRG
jgi:adenylate cyclase class 2